VKQYIPSNLTELGMQIDFSEKQCENTLSLISASRDPVSNVNMESEEQCEKHSPARNSTDAGIRMERRESQK
jgi:hypothetical protein